MLYSYLWVPNVITLRFYHTPANSKNKGHKHRATHNDLRYKKCLLFDIADPIIHR